MISPDAALFLATCVKARLNLVLSGPASSGKTTMLNVLAGLVPADQRVVTIEENAELRIARPKGALVRLEARTAITEGEGEIDVRALVKEALRMRADRIIVGEARSGEVLDILQVMRSGHDGSMTTVHATSPMDLVTRMTTMGMMAGLPIPEPVLRRMVVDAVDIVLQLGRFPSGERRVMQISEITLDDERVKVDDIFHFELEGYDERGRVVGRQKATGHRPRFLERFRQQGFHFPEEVFQP
jgi:pilus assembly protein CpaF